MQLAISRQVLHRQQLFAMQRTHGGDARINGLIAQRALVQLTDHHSAGATVPHRTALLGARQSRVPAQVLQYTQMGRHLIKADGLIVEQKTNHLEVPEAEKPSLKNILHMPVHIICQLPIKKWDVSRSEFSQYGAITALIGVWTAKAEHRHKPDLLQLNNLKQRHSEWAIQPSPTLCEVI
jgi:hypothetical protein